MQHPSPGNLTVFHVPEDNDTYVEQELNKLVAHGWEIISVCWATYNMPGIKIIARRLPRQED